MQVDLVVVILEAAEQPVESLVKQNGPVGRSCAWNEVGEGREFARIIAVKERRVALMAFRKAVGDLPFPEQEGVRHVVL